MSSRAKCYLCQTKARQTGISLHSFPKEDVTCSMWKRICGLMAEDNVSNVRICSQHFNEDDFHNISILGHGGKIKLKHGAVPSRSVPYPEKAQESSSSSHQHLPSTLSDQHLTSISLRHHLPSTSSHQHPLTTSFDQPHLSSTSSHQQHLPPSTSAAPVQLFVSELTEEDATVPDEQEITSSEQLVAGVDSAAELRTPRKRKFFEPRYLSEVHSPDVATPRRAKRALFLAKEKTRKQTLKIKALQEKTRRLKKKVKSIQELVKHLMDKNLMSEQAGNTLTDTMPENVKELIGRKLNSKSRAKYSPHLRSFALTLQFYSAKAYAYVRKVWGNLLPHPSTLRSWYTVVGGKPGFTEEAFKAISLHDEKNFVVNIVIDEMSIRQQIIYDFHEDKFYGGIDLGTEIEKKSDSIHEAKNALVFMGVAINGGWKVPLGYFLINSLTGSERANLFVKCLELLHQRTNVKVYSVTFDGAPVNISMCTSLGASFNFNSNFKPWVEHPLTKKRIFVFFDPSHMVKLVRNTLGDKGQLQDLNNEIIDWNFIKELEKLQSEEGLHAATKLRKKHVNFNDNRMNVKLASQTLSESVSNALRFVNELKIDRFKNCLPTANFALTFNNIFDLLNCRNKFAKKNKFNIPISDESYDFLKDNADTFIQYISQLKDFHGTPILQTNRKTGFLGFIICLTNIFDLYKVVKEEGNEYLLSFKISQDFLETYFSVIRSMGGFNNNPNAKQFESAYKRLLIRHELKVFDNSNCLPDGIDILGFVASRKPKENLITGNLSEVDQTDHDYFNTMWTLNPYVGNIVDYISGYIVKKIIDMAVCEICRDQLTSDNVPLLIKIKDRGGLLAPSADVCKICHRAEGTLRQHMHEVFNKKNIRSFLLHKTFAKTSDLFCSETMNIHIRNQDVLDNHRSELIKLIIEIFLKIRLHHESTIRSEKDSKVRHKYTKLILWKNQ